jgi:hypothetical protein
MGLHGSIVMEIKATKTSFLLVEFVHKRRFLNKDVHRLARRAVSLAPGRHVWFLLSSDGVCNSIMS